MPEHLLNLERIMYWRQDQWLAQPSYWKLQRMEEAERDYSMALAQWMRGRS